MASEATMPLTLPEKTDVRAKYALPERWLGQWVSPDEPEAAQADRPAYRIGRDLELKGGEKRATLFATALGIYEAFINGVRVGDAELTPGISSYDRTVYAQSFDVTSLLRAGSNRIELLLSDGWFRGRNGSERYQNCWGNVTAVLAQLEIESGNGDVHILGTDASWESRPSEVVSADPMEGQETNYSLPPADFTPVRVSLVSPPEPTISLAPPVRRIRELPALSVTSVSPDVSIVDFGQNIAGWARLTDLGEWGAQTTLSYGEHVNPDGELALDYLDVKRPGGESVPFRQLDSVVAGAGGDTFEPRHTLHGFRYIRVSHPGRTFDASSITAVVVHTDFSRTGYFSCSDERLNRLHEAGVWTFTGNAVGIPTDCPTRERLGWTGDYQIFAPTAAYLFDIEGFSRSWLQSVRDDQYDNGCLAMFSPEHIRLRTGPVDDVRRLGGGSAGWGDAAVAVPWTIYSAYGDRTVLEESWSSARAWVDYALRCAEKLRHPSRVDRSTEPEPREKYIWDGPFHFGEWLEPQPSPVDPPIGYDEGLAALFAAEHGEVGTAYLYRSCRQLGEMAEILGKSREAVELRATAGYVRDAWRAEFLLPDGRTALDTQAAYVRGISFGLFPDELIEGAASRLVELIKEAGSHLSTGFLSTGMLLPVLADTGHAELAYTLLTQTGVPSWLEMLNRGGTTFWEIWDNVDENGVVRQGSLNHYSKGAVVGFFYSHVLGLQQTPTSTSWKEIRVQPVLGGGLTQASGSLVTSHGRIDVEWQRDGDEVEVRVSVPQGIRGTIVLGSQDSTPILPGRLTVARSRISA